MNEASQSLLLLKQEHMFTSTASPFFQLFESDKINQVFKTFHFTCNTYSSVKNKMSNGLDYIKSAKKSKIKERMKVPCQFAGFQLHENDKQTLHLNSRQAENLKKS